jgi:hypothetical protein
MLETKYEMPDTSFSIFVRRETDSIYIIFIGKSRARDPANFLNPILHEAYLECVEKKTRIILDFSGLEYMNSATVAPVIKFWARLKASEIPLTIIYNHEVAWQKTSFSAFTVFEKESELFTLSTRES